MNNNPYYTMSSSIGSTWFMTSNSPPPPKILKSQSLPTHTNMVSLVSIPWKCFYLSAKHSSFCWHLTKPSHLWENCSFLDTWAHCIALPFPELSCEDSWRNDHAGYWVKVTGRINTPSSFPSYTLTKGTTWVPCLRNRLCLLNPG